MSREDGDRDERCDLKSFSEVMSWSVDMMSESRFGEVPLFLFFGFFFFFFGFLNGVIPAT